MVPENLRGDQNFARQQVLSEILEKTEENAFFIVWLPATTKFVFFSNVNKTSFIQRLFNFLKTKTEYFFCYAYYTRLLQILRRKGKNCLRSGIGSYTTVKGMYR
jgi:hypothetical protein